MKLDTGIHIAMHSVLSLKPGVTAVAGLVLRCGIIFDVDFISCIE